MTTNNRPLKVFLCHASGDKPIVRELYRQLSDEGWIDVWFDEEKLLPGQDWDLEIETAVESTDVVIVCLSRASTSKEGYVQKELNAILDIALEKPEGTIFVIPLRLDDCVVPRKLREWHWADYFPEKHKKIVYKRLLRSLQERMKKINEPSVNEGTPLTKTEILASQARRYELVGDFWNALQIYYKIKKIDPLFPRVDINIEELEREFPQIPARESFELPHDRDNTRKINLSRLSPRVIAFVGFACFIFVGLLSLPLIQRMFASPSSSPTQTVQPTSTLEPSPIPEEYPTAEQAVSPTLPIPTPDSTILGKNGMPLILVPAGEFLMGSRGNEPDESPVHTVYLDDYLIDQTEVTNSMYALCVKDEICEPPKEITSYSQNAGNNSFYYGNRDFNNYPVIYVSWYDANTYCMWAGRRLPTEAEWEKAASWDETQQRQRLFPWNNEKIDCSYANYYGNGDKLCVEGTTPVGSYPKGASFYGVLDMAGNVWEWVADRYDPEFYTLTEFINPIGRSGSNFVRRGGSFLTGWAIGIRSADRNFIAPDFVSQSLGFRCAMDAE